MTYEQCVLYSSWKHSYIHVEKELGTLADQFPLRDSLAVNCDSFTFIETNIQFKIMNTTHHDSMQKLNRIFMLFLNSMETFLIASRRVIVEIIENILFSSVENVVKSVNSNVIYELQFHLT